MSDPSTPLRQPTFWDDDEFTCLEAAQAGLSRSDSQDGPAHAGQGRHRANHTPQPENGTETQTNETSGPRCSDSSKSAGHLSSSESKSPAPTLSEVSLKLLSSPRFKQAITTAPTSLRSESPNDTLARILKRLLPSGSMEYDLTWQKRVTPSGHVFWERQASARRTEDSDFFGLPFFQEQTAAELSPWPTARSTDGDKGIRTSEGSIAEFERKGTGADLPTVAHLSPWTTPQHLDEKGVTQNFSREDKPKDDSLADKLTPNSKDGIRHQLLGRTTSSSSAETAKAAASALNPAFSEWLIGFPPAWSVASPGFLDWQIVQMLLMEGAIRVMNNHNSHRQSAKKIKDACEMCGADQRRRHVHHKDGNGLNNSESNLITLCVPCHRRWHSPNYTDCGRKRKNCLHCAKPCYRKGLCGMHLQRMKKYGSPFLSKRMTPSGYVLVTQP